MNDETERIYKELLKQYANAFTQAGKDGSEENVRRFQVMHDLALKLLQIKFDKKLATRLLDAIAARSLNHQVNYDDIDIDIDDIRALDAIDFLWLYCQQRGAGTNREGCKYCAIIEWCIGLGPKCPGNLTAGVINDDE